jgi:hypothetical protein
MVATVEVDENTLRSLEFAARVAGTTPGRVVARLVETASKPWSNSGQPLEQSDVSTHLGVFADYQGHRTHGQYDRITGRIDIASGPLSGHSFKSPTGAARAVIRLYKPGINPNRNGWSFWMLDDGSGKPLQSIRWLKSDDDADQQEAQSDSVEQPAG